MDRKALPSQIRISLGFGVVFGGGVQCLWRLRHTLPVTLNTVFS